MTKRSRSEAIRSGLRAASKGLRERQKIKLEAEALARDEDDRAEAEVVREMMEDLRAAW